MLWLLKRIEDGKYVANPGSKQSYTTSIKAARKFSSRNSALAEACGNETVVSVDEEVS